MVLLLAGFVNESRGRRNAIAVTGEEPEFIDLVEEGREFVIITARQRIELVIMTTRAIHGESQHGGSRRLDAVKDLIPAKLFGVTPRFIGLHRQAVEGRGDALVLGCVRQHIPRQLPLQKFVVGQVVVESADHPVAPRPDETIRVFMTAISVGIARRIAPNCSHALAITW